MALRRRHSQKALKIGVQAWAVALGVRARQNFFLILRETAILQEFCRINVLHGKPYWAWQMPDANERNTGLFPRLPLPAVNRQGYLLASRAELTWARTPPSPRPQCAGRAMGAA